LFVKGVLGIDTSQKNIVSGEIYAVHIPFEGISLKRVFLDGITSGWCSGRKTNCIRISSCLGKARQPVVGSIAWVAGILKLITDKKKASRGLFFRPLTAKTSFKQ
jgi:hypothetical protein